jgi:hypothetical protein
LTAIKTFQFELDMGALVSSSNSGRNNSGSIATRTRASPLKGIKLGKDARESISSPSSRIPVVTDGNAQANQQIDDHHHHHHGKSASRNHEKSTSKSSSAGHSSKRKSRKRHQNVDVPNSTDFQHDNEHVEKLDHDGTASVSDTSHAWLSEALTEDRESSEEMIRSLKIQLLTAQQERDTVRTEMESVIQNAAADKGRLDRMLLVAAKETARVEEEKMKILLEFASYKEKVRAENAAYDAELRRLKAELAMSIRHEGSTATAPRANERI